MSKPGSVVRDGSRESAAALPSIPAKRYFTIGEVSELCAVKPHVLRYWEQEFTQLKPIKRSGNRRYYQHHEVLLIRRIRELLYEQGFTINGARNRLESAGSSRRRPQPVGDGTDPPDAAHRGRVEGELNGMVSAPMAAPELLSSMRLELESIRGLLVPRSQPAEPAIEVQSAGPGAS
jgi:DNA-binding transcriptional MerR regulator